MIRDTRVLWLGPLRWAVDEAGDDAGPTCRIIVTLGHVTDKFYCHACKYDDCEHVRAVRLHEAEIEEGDKSY